MSPPSPVLFYDGVCGYCNWIVRFIAKIDRDERIQFAPLQSELAKQVLAKQPDLAGLDTAILYVPDDERLWTRWGLTRGLLPSLRGFWRIGCALLAALPMPVGNWIYDLIAKYRYRIFGKFETCKLPDAKLRKRLADFPE